MSIVNLDSSPSPMDKSLSPDDFEQQKAASNADIEKVTVQNSYQQMTEILTIPGVVAGEPVLSVYLELGSLNSTKRLPNMQQYTDGDEI